MRRRVHELAGVLVVTICKWSASLSTNANPVYSHPYNCKSIVIRSWWKHAMMLRRNDSRIFKALHVCCKFWDCPCTWTVTCGVPRTTIRDWLGREGTPLTKLGRIVGLLGDAEKQLHQGTVCLQVGFGLRLNHIRRFSLQIYKKYSTQNQWRGRMAGKG